MPAKEVQVSDDSGVTWKTLPGGQGEWNDEAGQIADTIFGQSYKSTQTGLIAWNSNANALYKGFAGYVASIKSSGISSQVIAEALSLVSGKTYQVTLAARRVLDHTKTQTFKHNGVAIAAADIATVDYLFGRVTLHPNYVPTGNITLDGWYLPMAEVAKANSFTLTQTAEAIDESSFQTARANGGYKTHQPGLRTVGLELGGFYDATSEFWDLLESRDALVVEINPDGSGLSLCRGIFKLATRGQGGSVGALEEETRKFELAVPDAVDVVFNWLHDDATTLSDAIQILLNAWLNETTLMVRYLPDGPDQVGLQGTAVLTDVSLSSGMEAMNEFSCTLMGSGAPTRGGTSS